MTAARRQVAQVGSRAGPAIQSRPVRTQRLTIKAKNACPVTPWTAARRVEFWVTRVPPRSPLDDDRDEGEDPSPFIDRRGSAARNQPARIKVERPTAAP